jgi:peroxiredoxin
MKKLSVIILVLALVITGCGDGKNQSTDGVHIIGKVERPIEGENVVIAKFGGKTGWQPVDTIEVAPSGEINFYVDVKSADFYRISFYNRQIVNLVLDSLTQEVEIMVEGDNPQGEVSIKGSKHTTFIQQIEGKLKDQQADLQDLNAQAREASQNQDNETLERLREEYFDLMRVRQEEFKEYLWSITPSLAVAFGLESLPFEEHYTFYDSVAQKLIASYPNHDYAKQLVDRVEGSRKLAIGAVAPEISLPNPDGEEVALSSLRGNYVLIDFWAAWCRPCRAEMPNVVRLYNEYGDENFEIYGVSLDKTRDAWLKAIDDDGLTWVHVSDLKYFNSEAASTYQIEGIPATYLLDPEGKIIAKGLRGQALAAKLAEIFG